MKSPIDPQLLGACPLFAGHGLEELVDIAQYMRPVEAEAGSRLFTQGDPAEGLYVVERGKVRIVSRLPGDKAVELVQIGPGELFGEVALVIHGRHSTTAEVIEPFKGCFFSRLHFEMLRSDLRPSAFRTMNAITETICARIRGQVDEVRESLPKRGKAARAERFSPRASARQPRSAVGRSAHRPSTPAGRAGAGDLAAGSSRQRSELFDPDRLRRLPLFQPYSETELKALVEPLRSRHLARGARLIAPGDPPGRCILVVRGALRLSVQQGAAQEQVAILGPSQMTGQLALMDGRAEPLLCEAREAADVLEMSRSRFQTIRAAADPLAFGFFESVNRSLVALLRKNNRLLSLLAVQGRLPQRVRQST
ncbi:MAG: cyclic nucleotide-binding domain-containing protein [SAR324 cluster bacterium]